MLLCKWSLWDFLLRFLTFPLWNACQRFSVVYCSDTGPAPVFVPSLQGHPEQVTGAPATCLSLLLMRVTKAEAAVRSPAQNWSFTQQLDAPHPLQSTCIVYFLLQPAAVFLYAWYWIWGDGKELWAAPDRLIWGPGMAQINGLNQPPPKQSITHQRCIYYYPERFLHSLSSWHLHLTHLQENLQFV